MSNTREKGVVVCRPIVYGSIAFFLGRKADEAKTHRWHIYVRGLQCEDLSYILSKVVFKLHPSFPNPIRVLTEPPFEISESGWGEFEVKIEMHFQDPTEKPIEISHPLQLYPPGNQPPSAKRPVIHEFYDELVFNEPTEFFYKKLMAGPDKDAPTHPLKEYFPNYSQTKDVQSLMAAQKFVNKELRDLKDNLIKVELEMKRLKDEISAN